MQFNDIYQVVETEFARTNEIILEQLSSNVPMVEKIGHHIIESGGKRMRPLLVLLAAKALESNEQNHPLLASIIEFLHTATLLHDDVVDTSDMRRGKATANAAFGNAPSVLVGDFLYSRAFEMMVQLGSMEVMAILSNATCVIAEGEVMQLMNVKNPNVGEDKYMDVIQGKTAMLFEASSHSGAKLANASPEQAEALRLFGHHLGMAFQLVDDVLDYIGNADELGKNVGDDLAEGKPTLPLIFAMQNASQEQADVIRQAIRKGGTEDLPKIIEIVQSCGAIDYTQQKAQEHVNQACEAIAILADTPAKQALQTLADMAINRNK
ncbi:octaprenyl diphosphate synthase [Bermanella marisrubri]|uniref:Octaprenyl diphosphate synthase n=1 Tax=Bermanella marisrubri TaxID=207949 RepID=Q1MZU0_9GAMM|nr:octaprenyl diphosphate synthase [Bermanella marisrubri]EAT11467.1 Trans-hexaprenyltranstransferase [Oceanobacter sp. RED65] [Bermanella marisrubri]QIZ85044.1 octaprenyl diphosphate synthase [Bermanella marisrubri]